MTMSIKSSLFHLSSKKFYGPNPTILIIISITNIHNNTLSITAKTEFNVIIYAIQLKKVNITIRLLIN